LAGVWSAVFIWHTSAAPRRARSAWSLWLDGACVSVDMRANAGVSFASSDFKLFAFVLHYFFPVWDIISQSEFVIFK
jgi:hypothetical protein